MAENSRGTRDEESNAIEVEEQLVMEHPSCAVSEGWLRCPPKCCVEVEVEGEEVERTMRFCVWDGRLSND